jgi:hypothetical protein
VAAIDDALEAERQHRQALSHPKGWEPGYTWDGSAGVLTTKPLVDRPRQWDEFIRDAGLDPVDVEVIEPVNVRGWDANMGRDPVSGEVTTRRMHYYRLNLRRRASLALPDLPTVMRLAKAAARRTAKTPPDELPERAVVAVFADPQTGKVASRGGTEQLIARYAETMQRFGNYIADANAQEGVWLDAGDAVESFENTLEQQQTNDLSLMSQVDVATALEFDGIDLMCKLLPRVVAAGVGSNHCRWRQGKANMGTPADDWGLHMLRQVHRWTRKLAAEQYSHLSVLVPQKHDETLAIDVCGQIIGLAHGHQVARPNMIPDWWSRQTHGGQPIGDADILVTGHFHHLRVEPVGRNPHTNRSRWWLQAPTLDNGSDWFRHHKGYDSDPGFLVFTVTRGSSGWDNLRIL